MPNMSLLELLFALLLVCVLLAVGVVAALVGSLVRRADGQVRDVAELRSRLEAGGLTQESQAAELRERLTQTQSVGESPPAGPSARQRRQLYARSGRGEHPRGGSPAPAARDAPAQRVGWREGSRAGPPSARGKA